MAGTQQLSGNGTRYYLESVVAHDDFVNFKRNDIALLKTNETIVYVPDKVRSQINLKIVEI